MTTSIPAWLEAPPEAAAVTSPVQTRTQALPFSELTWPNFERLVLRLVRREQEVVDCAIYGTPGQSQEGLDILAAIAGKPDKRTCYQCKKVQKFDPSDVRVAIDTFLDGKWADMTTEFILCVAIPLESTQQQDEIEVQRDRLQKQGIGLTIWDGAPAGMLSELLKQFPELVDDFFGRSWVADFNGNEAVESLGDRLDGIELDVLRRRLASLYSTVFVQHDPGLRIESGISVNYLNRYVPVDVTEQNTLSLSSSSQPALNEESSSEATLILDQDREPSQSISQINAYESRRPAMGWLQDKQHCMILGEPGYGKSTMLRFLALSLLLPEMSPSNLLGPGHSRRTPVWLSFARFSAFIGHNYGASVDDYFSDWLHQYSFDNVNSLFIRALCNSEVLLLVDGLDEAVMETNGREALDRIIAFVDSHDAAIFCTSRPRNFNDLRVPSFWPTATLAPLSDNQVQLLATKWFAMTELSTETDSQSVEVNYERVAPRAEAFLRAVNDNQKTRELARNPLLCQALIELFWISHRLPEERIVAYQQIIELLLSRHPDARAHAAFAVRPAERLGLRDTHLKETLVRLAADLQVGEQGGVARKAHCENICATFLADETFGLGLSKPDSHRQAVNIVAQLVTTYGILVERAPDELSFVHLSIQEYLAAEYMTRETEEDQLDWISRIWLKPNWRECLICWFGIQGLRGKKALSGQAADNLGQIGMEGEWQRMLYLDLLTEVACTDLGLPVGKARMIVKNAAHDVEVSPFLEYRTSLARNITLGTLGTTLLDVCSEAVVRWVPGYNSSMRSCLLHEFRKWQPSSDLRDTLLRALHDEDGRCRRTAAEALVKVFPGANDVQSTLESLALCHVRPEVRAAALHGLALRPEWEKIAGKLADANLISNNAELLFVVMTVRVQQKRHNESDMRLMLHLWNTNAVDFWSRNDFVDLFCEGWPDHAEMRETFIDFLSRDPHFYGKNLPIEYLLRYYPKDDEVVSLIVNSFVRNPGWLSMDSDRIWRLLYYSYRGHPKVAGAVRTMLDEHKEKYSAIHWHPNTVPGYIVIGNDDARDELLDSYLPEEFMGRYWIAKTLIEGWPEDNKVLEALQSWSIQDADIAAPLANWATLLRPVVHERQDWLKQLVSNASAKIVSMAITLLIKEFPNEGSHTLVMDRLNDSELWYYHRIKIEALLARAFPNHSTSLEIVERSLCEIDGPSISDFASSFQHNTSIRPRILGAAVAASVDVRMVVASTIRDRTTSLQTIERLTPCIFAEESSPVRATALIARARAARSNESADLSIVNILLNELSSLGTYLGMRRRTAFAALLELGQHEKIAEELVKRNSTNWASNLIDHLKDDAVSISTVISHWHVLKPLLEANEEVDAKLPVNEIVSAGFGALLDQAQIPKEELDEYLRAKPPDWNYVSYLEQLARRFPRSKLLLHELYAILDTHSPYAGYQYRAAQLLAENFAPDEEILSRLSDLFAHKNGERPITVPGVVGYLSRGWPGSFFEDWVHGFPTESYSNWEPRDRLIVAIVLHDSEAAEEAAKLLAKKFDDLPYIDTNRTILRLWSQDADSASALLAWSESTDGTLSVTALSLIRNRQVDAHFDVDALCQRFNDQMTTGTSVPIDGLDAMTGKVTSWAVRAYATIFASTRL